jgi:chemotaxis protein MotD
LASATGPKAALPGKVVADQSDKAGSLNASTSEINASQIDRPQTADATPASNTAAAANAAHATNAGSAGSEEHRNGNAEVTTEGKKEHAPATAAASRIATQNPEPLATPHAEAHAADGAGRTSDGVQSLTPPQPADRLAAVASSAAPSASAQDAGAAAVPLAGLAVEIAARAQAGRNRFEIRLDPPELGRIDVRLDIDRSGQVTSRLTVDRVETLDALRRDAGDLERALQQAGLRTADNGLQFALRDQSFAGRDQSFPAPAAARVVIPAPELAALDTMPAGYGRMPRPGGGIDIRV